MITPHELCVYSRTLLCICSNFVSISNSVLSFYKKKTAVMINIEEMKEEKEKNKLSLVFMQILLLNLLFAFTLSDFNSNVNAAKMPVTVKASIVSLQTLKSIKIHLNCGYIMWHRQNIYSFDTMYIDDRLFLSLTFCLQKYAFFLFRN